MKFLYFGDIHEQPGSPKNRTDNYRETVNAKIKEIQSIGRKHNIRAFLQPGDFLNAPKYDYAFLTEVVNRWSSIDVYELMKMMMTGKVSKDDVSERLNQYTPILGAVGNHELYGESLASYPKTSLAFLESIGFMHFPTKENPFIFTDDDGLTVAVSATNYDIGMDEPDRIDDYIVTEKKGDIHIHIVHGYLTNKDMGDMFPHTVLDAIAKKTKADLTVTGHDHMGFPLTEVEGKLFINPGAPVRLKNDKKEMKRRPKVLLIEASKETGLTVKPIYLKTAEKGEDVLSRDEIDHKNGLVAKMEEIKSIVNKANVKSGNNIKEVIASIADNDEIADNIKDASIQRVAAKMDAIKQQAKSFSPYKVDKIVLENFQSHILTELPVSGGLNVFVGTSGAGKSAIMRAFAWVYENEGKNPRRFIHRGKTFAKVSLYLSNGIVVSRVIEKKASGKNGYEIFNPATGEVEEYNTKSLPLVQDVLGFTKLDIDMDKAVPLNFQRQGEGWFFIGDGFTPSTRAKVIGAVYQTHFVDAVLKDLEAETKRLNIVKKEKETSLTETTEKMSQYAHIPSLKKNIQLLEHKIAQYDTIKEKRKHLKGKYDTLCHIESQVKMTEDVVSRLSGIDEAQVKLSTLQARLLERTTLQEKMKRLAEMKSEASAVLSQLKKLGKVEEAREKMNQLVTLLEQRNKVQSDVTAYKTRQLELETLQNEMKFLQKRIDSTSYSQEAEEKLTKLRNMVADRNVLAQKIAQKNSILDEGKGIAKNVEKAKADLKQQMKAYEVALNKLGTCPVCKSTVDQQKIKQILTSHAV